LLYPEAPASSLLFFILPEAGASGYRVQLF
jgi:hypothetical protein